MRRYAPLCFAALIWGAIPVIVDRAQTPAIVFVALRMGFASAALGLGGTLVRRELNPRGNLGLLAAMGAMLAFVWFTFIWAIQLLPGATAVLITYVFPVITAVIAPLILRESREPHVLPLAVAGFVGLALISAPETGAGRGTGVAIAVAGAAVTSLMTIAARKAALLLPPVTVAFWQQSFGFTVVVPWAILNGAPRGIPWAWGVLVGVVCTAFTSVLFFRTLARIPAQEAGVLMYLEPVSAVLFAWAFLAATPTALTALGGLLVVSAGAALVVISGRRATADV